MTPKLPVVTPRNMIAALKRAGFYIDRQRGSHVILKRDQDKKTVTVAIHPTDLHKAIVHSILTQAGLSVDDLNTLL